MADIAVFLFHREFRLYDNTGLNAIARSGKKIIPVFIFTPQQIDPKRNKYFSNGSVQFMCESLDELDRDIRKLGSKMIFMHGETVKTLDKLHKKFKFDNLLSHEDNTPFADKRDANIRKWADARGVNFEMLEDYDLYSYRDGLRNGVPFQKFTPYYNYCLKNLKVHPVDTFKMKKEYFVPASRLSVPGSMDGKQIHKYYDFNEHINIHGGRENGKERLANLKNMGKYDKTRDDINSSSGTSKIGSYLKYGTISIREVYWRLEKLFGKNHALIRELIWRSFYYRVAKYTDVLKGRAMRKNYENVKWSRSKADLKKFETATTGVPLVDASLRNLFTTSWLHNRLRMVVSMFATKDLLLHWTLPEVTVARHFIDYDPSSTNGGIQWSASVGCDAANFTRTFNSYRQIQKFDPDCIYVKKWLPELRNVPPKHIIDWENQWMNYKNTGYFKPMINHKEATKIATNAIVKGIYK